MIFPRVWQWDLAHHMCDILIWETNAVQMSRKQSEDDLFCSLSYHLTYYLKSFCFFWFCPGDKLNSECPCCPTSCVALVLNWFVTVHFGFLFELISGCGVFGRIPRILGPLSTLSLSYHRRLKLLGKQVSSHFSAETALYISVFEKVVDIILQ